MNIIHLLHICNNKMHLIIIKLPQITKKGKIKDQLIILGLAFLSLSPNEG